MFKRLIYFSTLGLTALVYPGCMKKWLDAKSEGSLAVPSQVKDFRALLDNPKFAIKVNSRLGEIACDQDTITEGRWQIVMSEIEGNAYSWTENVPYLDIVDWTNSYERIFNCNLVLEGLEKLSDDAQVSQMKGEAMFHRGKQHYSLATIFAHSYNAENPGDEFGLPIRLSTSFKEESVRLNVEQTYNYILADLKSSLQLLPENDAIITRPLKRSARGLLARVYLSMEMYDSAYYYAEEYLERNSQLIDFNTLDPAQQFYDLNVEIGNLCYFGSSISGNRIPKSLFLKYEENDLRSLVMFRPVGQMYVFKGTYSRDVADTFIGVATDEMYLISAECLARKGKIAEAMERLNTLLRTRWAVKDGQSTYVDKVAATADEALLIILTERAKTLVRRDVRWSDLRRLNKDPRFAVTLKRTVGGQEYTLEPNSYKYTFPIPRNVTAISGMKQNPGWAQ